MSDRSQDVIHILRTAICQIEHGHVWPELQTFVRYDTIGFTTTRDGTRRRINKAVATTLTLTLTKIGDTP